LVDAGHHEVQEALSVALQRRFEQSLTSDLG